MPGSLPNHGRARQVLSQDDKKALWIKSREMQLKIIIWNKPWLKVVWPPWGAESSSDTENVCPRMECLD